LARNGVPKSPFYVTGRIGERAFSVHSEGERMILKREGHERTEVDLTASETVAVPLVSVAGDQPAAMPLPVCPDGSPPCDVPPEEEVPGASPLDTDLGRMDEALEDLPQSEAGQGGTP
jgi:hypothetical protein